jgi:hypothetical protein
MVKEAAAFWKKRRKNFLSWWRYEIPNDASGSRENGMVLAPSRSARRGYVNGFFLDFGLGSAYRSKHKT